jgi:hypothetical protein
MSKCKCARERRRKRKRWTKSVWLTIPIAFGDWVHKPLFDASEPQAAVLPEPPSTETIWERRARQIRQIREVLPAIDLPGLRVRVPFARIPKKGAAWWRRQYGL